MARVRLSGLRGGSRVHFLLAWVLCVLALLLTAATWLPGPNKVPFAAVGFVFVAIFPVFGAALLRALISDGGRNLLGTANSRRMSRFVRSLSIGLKCSYVAVFLVALSAVATGGGTAHDAKTDGHGGYYYTRYDKSERRSEEVVLTENEYHEANKAQARIFASLSAVFHATGGFLVLVAASPEATRRAENESETASGTG